MSEIPLIVERMLLHDHVQNLLIRVVYVDRSSNTAWLCRIDDGSWPYQMELNLLLEELEPSNGSFEFEVNDPWSQPGMSSEMETATDNRQKQNYTLIEPLITGDNEHLILIGKERRRLIASRLKEVKSTRQTICKLLLCFWKRGMTYSAIRPDYIKCGGSGQKRNSTNKKIGAPRTIAPGTGISINDDMRHKLQVGVDFWLAKKKPSPQQQEALDYVIRLYYSKPITDGKKIIRYEEEPDKKPTLRQFQTYIDTNYPKSHIRRKREGEKMWNLHNRELLGVADGAVQGPGDCFQIDATVADVYLVSQFDRRRIVGRPIIYFVLDVFSRLITGLYVGFEGPSWIGAMMALVNMVTPKVEFCRQYELDIKTEDWPSHFAPKRIMADRGELMSVKLGENITKELHIEIENASPGRPDLKSLVERRFGIVQAKFKQFTPGYVEQDFGERGAKDYRCNAVLNIHEFTRMVILAVNEHNFTPIRNKKVPTMMITDGYIASPLDLWEWGVKNCSGTLRTFSVDEVALNVMPPDTARVTANGIKFKTGLYTCPTALSEDWFANARQHEWTVDVSYDPRDMGKMYIRDKQLPNGFEHCQLLPHCGELQGKSQYEIEEKDIALNINTVAKKNGIQEKRIFNDVLMEQTETNAINATKAVTDKNTPKSQRIADIRNNRLAEKEIQRGAELFQIEDSSINITTIVSPDTTADSHASIPQATSTLALLKMKRKEREGRENGQDT